MTIHRRFEGRAVWKICCNLPHLLTWPSFHLAYILELVPLSQAIQSMHKHIQCVCSLLAEVLPTHYSIWKQTNHWKSIISKYVWMVEFKHCEMQLVVEQIEKDAVINWKQVWTFIVNFPSPINTNNFFAHYLSKRILLKLLSRIRHCDDHPVNISLKLVKVKNFLCAVTAAIKRQTMAIKVFENIFHEVIVRTEIIICLIIGGLCSWKRSLQFVRNESYSLYICMFERSKLSLAHSYFTTNIDRVNTFSKKS